MGRPSPDRPEGSLYSKGPSENRHGPCAPPSVGLVRRPVSPGSRKELANQREC